MSVVRKEIIRDAQRLRQHLHDATGQQGHRCMIFLGRRLEQRRILHLLGVFVRALPELARHHRRIIQGQVLPEEEALLQISGAGLFKTLRA